MANLRFTQTSWVFGIVIILLCCPLSSALTSITGEGRWPSDWPIELSPYRAKARTKAISWPGNQQTIYEIHFKNSGEFEKIWPTILKLKSKEGTLKLSGIEKPHDAKVSWFTKAEPAVLIYAPVHPAWPITFPGGKKLIPAPPWPESAKWANGELPEYVTYLRDDPNWVPYLGDPNVHEDWHWVPYMLDPNIPLRGWRARIDIELVVDAQVIDLNRIRLPADTPIIDNRKLPVAR